LVEYILLHIANYQNIAILLAAIVMVSQRIPKNIN